MKPFYQKKNNSKAFKNTIEISIKKDSRTKDSLSNIISYKDRINTLHMKVMMK